MLLRNELGELRRRARLGSWRRTVRHFFSKLQRLQNLCEGQKQLNDPRVGLAYHTQPNVELRAPNGRIDRMCLYRHIDGWTVGLPNTRDRKKRP
jgi:hypothetical protein